MSKMKLSDEQLRELSNEIRTDMFEMIREAGSGHLGGCSSSTELMTSLYFGDILNYNPNNPFDENRDRVLVRGHLGPLRYKIFSLLGWLDESELKDYRSLGSRLQGHESKDLVPGVDITPSGSLGMLLSYGVGAALAAKKQGKDFRTYCFLGDGEEQEGNVSEAARHASKLGLDNLVCILDKNKKQLSHPVEDVDIGNIEEIWKGYGWDVFSIRDGHNFKEIKSVFLEAINSKFPAFIIADTIKGKEIDGCEESHNGYHTISSCPRNVLDKAIDRLGKNKKRIIAPNKKDIKIPERKIERLNIETPVPNKLMGLEDATDGYLREAERRLGEIGKRFYIMTADLVDSNYINSFNFSPTTSFTDVGIREQHLFASAYAISITDPDSRVWIHSGDSFLYRASDQLNAACQGNGRMIIIGDRPGLGGGKNGQTHQSSGQPGLALTMPGLTFFEPADVDDLYNCLDYSMNEYPNPIYIRLHPGQIERLPSEEEKNINNYIVSSPDGSPDITLVGSGLVMKNTVDAVKKLSDEGINAKLINVVNPKTLRGDFATKLAPNVPVHALYNGNPFVLESAIATAIMSHEGKRPSKISSQGFEYGTSGSVENLLKHYDFNSNGIVNKVKGILR